MSHHAVQVLMGVAACRLVMVETVDDEGKPLDTPPAPAGSALLPALALLGITAARAAGWLTLNDPLTRALLFVPLFTLLVVRIHRNTLQGAKGFTGMLGHPLLTYLVSAAAHFTCCYACLSICRYVYVHVSKLLP
jgi:hypothetical protein